MGISTLEKFKSTVVRPDDFDAFWDDTLARLGQIPLNASVEHVPLRSTPEIDVYDVHYDSWGGVRIAAWYSVPTNREGPLPGLLFVPGYQSDPPIQKGMSAKGYAVLSIAPRGKVRSLTQFNAGYPGLLTHNMVDRNTYSYRGFYSDAIRGFEFLQSRDEVVSERIGVRGASQGGGLALAVAGLCPGVAAASSGVPYLCGHLDAIELSHTYPYYEIADYIRRYPERKEDVRQTLAYFDCTNFGPRISCPIIVNVGMQDNVCPPETGYAAYLTIASTDKKFYPYEGHGHDGGRDAGHGEVIDAFFEKHLKD